MQYDLSIIMVTFNSRDIALKGIDSYLCALTSSPKLTWEIIVVDNASHDGVADAVDQQFPVVNLIRNQENVGYSAACNLGFKSCSGRYILFANPDTEINSETLPVLIDLLERNQSVGACTPFLRLSDNDTIDLGAHRGFPTPWVSFTHYSGLSRLCRKSRRLSTFFGRYHLLEHDLTEAHKIDVIEGGFFLVRREAFIAAGGWDEDYFLFGEDIDLCLCLAGAGYQIMYYPQATAIHHLGVSTGLKSHPRKQNPVVLQDRLRAYHAFFDSMKIFYDKHYAEKYGRILRWVIFKAIEMKRRQRLGELKI